MKIQLVGQPVSLQTGAILRQLLVDHRFSEATLVSAFVKRAGVIRVAKELDAFRGRAGTTLICVAGIDHGGTTREGLQALHDHSDELFVVHSTNPFVTFHPKIALFGGAGHRAAIVGSSNFTAGGLFSNIEASVYVERENDGDDAFFDDLEALCSEYRSYPGCSVQITAANLPALGASLPPEIITLPSAGVGGKANAAAGPPGGAGLFGAGTFKAPPKAPGAGGSGVGAVAQAKPPSPPPVPPSGQGFWKIMSSGDVSLKSSPGQIIIPIEMVRFFPKLGPNKTMPSGAEQAETFLDVDFRDGAYARSVANARLVKYSPAPNHKRTNTEYRFTFKDRAINPGRLNQGDILLFRRTAQAAPWFEVERVVPGTPLFARLRATAGGDFGVI